MNNIYCGSSGDCGLRGFLDILPDVVCEVNRDFRVMYVNRTGQAFFGHGCRVPEKDVSVIDYIHPDDRVIATQQLEALFRGESAEPCEYRVVNMDGEVRNARIVSAPMMKDGEVVGCRAAVIDVTTLREYEESLRENLEWYRLHVENSPEAIVRLDHNFNCIYINKALFNWLGGKYDDYIGRNIEDFLHYVHPDDHAMLFDSFRKITETGKSSSMQYRIVHDPGRVVWTNQIALPWRTPDGTIGGIEIIARDVTAAVEASEALRLSEERYRAIVEDQSELICRFRPDSTLTFVNGAYCRFFEKSKDQLIGSLFVDLIPEDDRQFTLNYITDATRDPTLLRQCYEHRVTLPDGTMRWMSWTDRPIYNSAGQLVELQSVGRDITELKIAQEELLRQNDTLEALISAATREYSEANHRLEKEIIERQKAEAEKEVLQHQFVQSQKMEAIGLLAGGIAHEFNNMLAVIMGSTDLLAIKRLTPSAREEVQRIAYACKRARDLVNQLLTFARQKPTISRSTDIRKVLESSADLIKAMSLHKIDIRLQLAPQPVIVEVDPSKIEQAVLNICTNSVDAMPNGGTLTISCDQTTLDNHSMPDLHNKTVCRITITDTGTGMPAEVVERIFDPFFTTKEVNKGTGLGLSTTYSIISEHRGEVTVDSQIGKGTATTIFFPIGTGKYSQQSETFNREVRRGTETILIVDDEPEVIHVARNLLEFAGYKPITATTGIEAIRLFREHKDEIRLILLDMVLPEMDGREICDEIRKIDPDIGILIVSGYSMEKHKNEMIEKGVKGFLRKPYTLADMTTMVRDALDWQQ